MSSVQELVFPSMSIAFGFRWKSSRIIRFDPRRGTVALSTGDLQEEIGEIGKVLALLTLESLATAACLAGVFPVALSSTMAANKHPDI